jgi:hypothetical protein
MNIYKLNAKNNNIKLHSRFYILFIYNQRKKKTKKLSFHTSSRNLTSVHRHS